MAKSLRSKIKRAHRTQLRKVYAEPLIKKRQVKIAKTLHKDIAVKKGGSLASLAAAMKKQEDEMDDEDDDVDEEEMEEKDGKKEAEVKSLPFKEPKGGSLIPLKGFGRQGQKRVTGAQATLVQKLKEKEMRKSKKVTEVEDKEAKKAKKKREKEMVWFK